MIECVTGDAPFSGTHLDLELLVDGGLLVDGAVLCCYRHRWRCRNGLKKKFAERRQLNPSLLSVLSISGAFQTVTHSEIDHQQSH